MPKDTRKESKPLTASDMRRLKQIGSYQYKSRVKNSIEMVATYNLLVNGSTEVSKKQLSAIRFFAERLDLADARSSSRDNSDNVKKDINFEEITKTPNKL